MTGFGLLLVLVGVGCGIRAYVNTVRQLDTRPVWPWADEQLKRLRESWPFRQAEQVPGLRKIDLTDHGIGSDEAFGTPTVIRADETVDERVARLERRLQHVEELTDEHRAQAERAAGQLAEQLIEQGRRLDGSDEQIRQLARSAAVGGVRLQLIGLIFVGIGTAIMAVPTLLAVL